MPLNSRDKGKRGEREFAKQIRELGWDPDARRGVQFQGGPDSPDIATGLPIHFEVKNTERFNLWSAMEQAEADALGSDKVPVVAYKKNKKPWVLCVQLEDMDELASILTLLNRGIP